VPQIILDGSGINPFISQVVTAGVPQHVWVGWKIESRCCAGPSDELVHRGTGQRPAAFGDEEEGPIGMLTPQLPERAQFITLQALTPNRPTNR